MSLLGVLCFSLIRIDRPTPLFKQIYCLYFCFALFFFLAIVSIDTSYFNEICEVTLQIIYYFSFNWLPNFPLFEKWIFPIDLKCHIYYILNICLTINSQTLPLLDDATFCFHDLRLFDSPPTQGKPQASTHKSLLIYPVLDKIPFILSSST